MLLVVPCSLNDNDCTGVRGLVKAHTKTVIWKQDRVVLSSHQYSWPQQSKWLMNDPQQRSSSFLKKFHLLYSKHKQPFIVLDQLKFCEHNNFTHSLLYVSLSNKYSAIYPTSFSFNPVWLTFLSCKTKRRCSLFPNRAYLLFSNTYNTCLTTSYVLHGLIHTLQTLTELSGCAIPLRCDCLLRAKSSSLPCFCFTEVSN